MNAWKTKTMLGLIWLGVVTLAGMSGEGKSILDWLMWAIHAGLLAGLTVALRHYYKQIRVNAVWEYRRNLMWHDYVRKHGLANGAEDHDS